MEGTMLHSPCQRVASDTRRQIQQRYDSSLTELFTSVLLQAVVGVFDLICFEPLIKPHLTCCSPCFFPMTLMLLIQKAFFSRTPNINCK